MIRFSTEGWEDYCGWVDNPKMLERVNRLVEEAARTPASGTGKPERLRGDLSGYWSRRIDSEHRVVYTLVGDDLVVVQARHHY